MMSKEHVKEDIELIILVYSERVIGGKLLKEPSQNFVKLEDDEFFERKKV